MVEDPLLYALRDEVRARGWYRPPTGLNLLQIASHVALALGGIAAFIASDSLFVRICALVVTTTGSLGITTFTHTASHYASVRRKWANELLTYFGFTFFWGESSTYWWNKHVVGHHPVPNVIGADPDADLSPWFALTEDEVRASHGLLRFYYERLQCYVFPFTLAGMVFGMQAQGWVFVLKALRDPARRSSKHWIDLGVLVLHYGVWIGLPMLFFSPLSVLGLYALRAAGLGYAVLAVAGPGHLPLYAACIGTDEPSQDFLMRQTATTANFTTGWLGRWLCGGLEYQVEHHLFPKVNHAYYPQLSPMVQELCRQRGVPYHTCSWDRALWKTYSVLATPKRLEPDLEVFRLPVPQPTGMPDAVESLELHDQSA
ncbi:MAG: hypothetical protein QOF89_2084 [Acidobacteriota bacterium]|jgi:fatty acid desaturase|nr:hypothetical protein [Acidobacteriota bacterium]